MWGTKRRSEDEEAVRFQCGQFNNSVKTKWVSAVFTRVMLNRPCVWVYLHMTSAFSRVKDIYRYNFKLMQFYNFTNVPEIHPWTSRFKSIPRPSCPHSRNPLHPSFPDHALDAVCDFLGACGTLVVLVWHVKNATAVQLSVRTAYLMPTFLSQQWSPHIHTYTGRRCFLSK